MKVYGHPLSSCTRKVLVVLAEKNTEPELFTVNLFEGAHKSREHLERHPFGVIPALDDDGFVLFESRAIIRYLDARLPGLSLTPTSLRDRARMEQWLSVDQSYVAPHTSALAVQRILRKHQGLEPDRALVEAAENGLARAFGIIDDALAESPYLAGECFSLADASLMPYVASLPMIGCAGLVAGLGHLAAWWEKTRARSSWARTEAVAA
jgi:glutathione S-transferase